MRSGNHCPSIRKETIFVNTENSKTNEPPKIVLTLSQRLDIKSSNKGIALQKLFITPGER